MWIGDLLAYCKRANDFKESAIFARLFSFAQKEETSSMNILPGLL